MNSPNKVPHAFLVGFNEVIASRIETLTQNQQTVVLQLCETRTSGGSEKPSFKAV